ncbi:MAG: hypothetical protein IT437_08430 [Phycisphaerales bacterium]|nr:hypothetical protein [Phycisphaerales bacterium]
MRPALLAAVALCPGAVPGPVLVVVDMDAARPGVQSSITVPPGTTVVPGVAVFIYDPEGTRSLQGIGYIGALDRGIAFGHTPPDGPPRVAGLSPTLGTPANPGNTGSVFAAMDRGFAGPEVQYIEYGAAAAAPIPAAPDEPVFRVDIHLNPASGTSLSFYLLDFVSVWSSGANGAFSTAPGSFLDTGGDSVPDQTRTLYGVDPDVPLPIPPAAYAVDYVDGPVSGAQVIVACYQDCNGDGARNLADFGCFQTRFALGDPYADCNGDGQLNLSDFGCFQTKFALGCP